MFVKFCFFAFFFLAHSQDLSINTEGHVFERDLETTSTTPAPMTTVTTPASMIPDVSKNQLLCIIAIVVGCVVSFFICAVCSCYLCKRYSKVRKMVDSIFFCSILYLYLCSKIRVVMEFSFKAPLFFSTRGPASGNARRWWKKTFHEDFLFLLVIVIYLKSKCYRILVCEIC